MDIKVLSTALGQLRPIIQSKFFQSHQFKTSHQITSEKLDHNSGQHTLNSKRNQVTNAQQVTTSTLTFLLTANDRGITFSKHEPTNNMYCVDSTEVRKHEITNTSDYKTVKGHHSNLYLRESARARERERERGREREREREWPHQDNKANNDHVKHTVHSLTTNEKH